MTINSYLMKLSKAAIIGDEEKAGIRVSIATLEDRLDGYFDDEISDTYVFGSYSRGTILPRNMDPNSDVDYLVVFSDRSYKPQTYLDKLNRFVDECYPTSEIYQSNPTIVLALNHIRFELVPAIANSGLQIPAKASSYRDWLSTDPDAFNGELVSANRTHNSLIKPLIRLVKYWNAQHGYPFESYSIEQSIVGRRFWTRRLLGGNLADYFFDYMEDLGVGYFAPKSQQEAIARTQKLIGSAKELERKGDVVSAESELSELFFRGIG